jgi:cytosine/adenosine deaminase-related metal-dependent hydrolase
LWCATAAGGDALRTGAGRLQPGAPAALVSLDLEAPALQGAPDELFAETVAVAARAGLAEPLEVS